MAKKKVDLKFFQENAKFFENIPSVKAGIENEKLLRLASVLIEFDFTSLKDTYRKIYNTDLRRPDEDFLKDLCVKVTSEVTVNPESSMKEDIWVLKDNVRTDFLKTSSPSDLLPIIDYVEDKEDSIKTIYYQYLKGEAPRLEEQNLNQLACSYNVSQWLSETNYSVPSEEEIIYRIREEELLNPFKALTGSFKGRKKELEYLASYIDWLPKSGLKAISESISSLFSFDKKKFLLIKGIGGIGKSTLVAEFILNHLGYTKNGKLPFVYFDFDKPGLSISDPLLLVVHAFSQLQVQFPEVKDYFKTISTDITQRYSAQQKGSGKPDRSEITRKCLEDFSVSPFFNKPVLVVFDSFEEFQHRAKSSEIISLFNFLSELNDFIPRLRLVFVGRSEIPVEVKDLEFQELPLESFDVTSALGYLESKGIPNETVRKIIYDKVGGHPLNLQLAAELVKKENFSPQVQGKEIERLFEHIDKKLIQEQLVQRNLDHIHDSSIRQLAIPGILVRRITPEIIRKVLAEPCGLGTITTEESEDLYVKLLKETFLITSLEHGVTFRQDVRIALYDLVIKSDNYDHQGIHEKAISYYENKSDFKDRAEYLYHRLKRGDPETIIEELYHDEMRVYIENSLKEFSPSAYLTFAFHIGITASSEIVQSANITSWEKFILKEMKEALKMRDEFPLLSLKDQLSSRKERTQDSEFLFYEAKVYQRLGDFSQAIHVLAGKSILHDTDEIKYSIETARCYEYLELYEESYKAIVASLALVFKMLSERFKDPESLSLFFDYAIIYLRIRGRLISRMKEDKNAERIMTEVEKIFGKFGKKEILFFLPVIYHPLFKKNNDTSLFLDYLRFGFMNGERFHFYLASTKKETKNKRDLEAYTNLRYKLSLKEISAAGSLAVNIYDVALFSETSVFEPEPRLEEPEQKYGSKKIVICCDGIWNRRTEVDRGVPVMTNVEILHHLIDSNDHHGTRQVKLYDKGLESETINLLVGGSTVESINRTIKNIYSFVCLNYNQGDDIYIFGYSRGAYMARSLVGLIRNCGILKKENLYMADKAYENYRDRNLNAHPDSSSMVSFRDQFCVEQKTKIKFIGVWETVGKLGIPEKLSVRDLLFTNKKIKQIYFHDLKLSSSVLNAYQALALDERRKLFSPCLWELSDTVKSDPEHKQVLEQRWFPGNHANVGGGYADSSLSDLSLEWMISKAKTCGLAVSTDRMKGLMNYKFNPNPLGEIRDSLEGILNVIAGQLRPVKIQKYSNETIDESVTLRLKEDASYRPLNLKNIGL
jgi:uncharacterized protein (DUF2235 family)